MLMFDLCNRLNMGGDIETVLGWSRLKVNAWLAYFRRIKQMQDSEVAKLKHNNGKNVIASG